MEEIKRAVIKKHLEGWHGLSNASIEYFAKSGKVSGSLFLALKDMLDDYVEQLRIYDVRYQLAISALESIVDPIEYMRKQLKEDEELNSMYAIRIAERPEFYQNIAKKALEEITNCT